MSNNSLLNPPIKDLHVNKKYENKIINIQEITWQRIIVSVTTRFSKARKGV
jgi:hypothetical protein